MIAKDPVEFKSIFNHPDFVDDWQMQNLVQQAHRKYGKLTKGQKFCLVIPGVLGGDYEISNINSVRLTVMIQKVVI